MKTEIKKLHLETDINNEPRLVMTDENGKEWAVSEATASAPASGAAFLTEIVSKDKCWFFNESNRTKPSVGGI